MSDKQQRIKTMMNEINKKFGAGTIQSASDAKDKLTKKVIPTPSIELNNALWCGGFCGLVELRGNHSSGKTSLAIETIAKLQQENKEAYVAWLETEGSITLDMFEQHNVDLDRLYYWRQEDVSNAENALDISRAIIYGGNYDLLVINSVAGLAPSVEIEEDLSKQNIAVLARLLSKYFRTITGSASKNNTTILFINQLRENVGVMFGDNTVATGGKALTYYASQIIQTNKLTIQDSDPIQKEDGVKISCSIRKNRFALGNNPYTKCIYYATYKNGIDNICNLPQILKDNNILRQSGAYWYYEDENNSIITSHGIEGKFKSKGALLEALRGNKEFREELMSKLDKTKSNTLANKDEIEEIEKEEQSIKEQIQQIG